jgi:hypothetical protein
MSTATTHVQACVCPAAPARTKGFVVAGNPSDPVALADRWLTARASRIRSLRSAGHLRDAERYGWLTLAAVNAGVTPTIALALDPRSSALHERARDSDMLPSPLAADDPPVTAVVPGTGIESVCCLDGLGYAVFTTSSDARSRSLVTFAGAQFAGPVFLDALAARLAAMAVTS